MLVTYNACIGKRFDYNDSLLQYNYVKFNENNNQLIGKIGISLDIYKLNNKTLHKTMELGFSSILDVDFLIA